MYWVYAVTNLSARYSVCTESNIQMAAGNRVLTHKCVFGAALAQHLNPSSSWCNEVLKCVRPSQYLPLNSRINDNCKRRKKPENGYLDDYRLAWSHFTLNWGIRSHHFTPVPGIPKVFLIPGT
jgi:hypothetical protein